GAERPFPARGPARLLLLQSEPGVLHDHLQQAALLAAPGAADIDPTAAPLAQPALDQGGVGRFDRDENLPGDRLPQVIILLEEGGHDVPVLLFGRLQKEVLPPADLSVPDQKDLYGCLSRQPARRGGTGKPDHIAVLRPAA